MFTHETLLHATESGRIMKGRARWGGNKTVHTLSRQGTLKIIKIVKKIVASQ